MITGNKGEWSEIYVLLRLLADGRIYAANEKVERLENTFFPILKIIREELKNSKYEYLIADKIKKIQIYQNGILTTEMDSQDFAEQANFLYHKIIEANARAFTIEDTEAFMRKIGCYKLAAPSTDKTDITMQIHDIQTGYEPVCGFSIKSELGGSPTLVNASKATNFVFEVTGLEQSQIEAINKIDTSTKIIDRINRIYELTSDVKFFRVNNEQFNTNLMLIDSRLTEMLGFAIIYNYRYSLSTCKEVVSKLESENPLNYPDNIFYAHKFKEFLCAAALGMTPARKWDGIDEANGGYIIVSRTGDVLAYHIYNRNAFKDYLLNNTKFERASTTKHEYATLYTVEHRTFINLNMQIRFI